MTTKKTLRRKDGVTQSYHVGRAPVEAREAVAKPPAATPAPRAPKAPRPLAPALQDLLTKNGINPATVRLRGEQPNDDDLDELAIFIDAFKDDEVDDEGELILDETFYSVRLAFGDKSIFEEELAVGEGRAWPDEDLDRPEYAAELAISEFGIRLHNDGDNACGSDDRGTWSFIYNVVRAEVPFW